MASTKKKRPEEFKIITEENVDSYIEYLINLNPNSKYINQAIAFSKSTPQDIMNLRAILLETQGSSVSNFMKHLLSVRYSGGTSVPSTPLPIALRQPDNVVTQVTEEVQEEEDHEPPRVKLRDNPFNRIRGQNK